MSDWSHGGKSRHERGYGSKWDRLRKTILQRDKYLCQHCLAKDRVTTGNQVDHIKPKSKGGTDDPGNLTVLCRPCHDRKTIADQGKVRRKTRPTTGLDGWPIDD